MRPSKGEKTPGSGRVKGTPNKETKDLREICAKYNINPFEAMLKLAVDDPDPDMKFDKLEKLLPYLEAKRSSVALGNEEGQEGFKIIVEDYRSKK